MIHYCKYCGAKTANIDMCQRCRENVRLIRIIKAMLRPYYNSKKAREREEKNGYNKDVHEH